MDEKTKAEYLGDIEYFSAKMEADKNSILFLPLASAYIKIGNFNDAVDTLRQGIDANQEMPVAKTLLAEAYIGLGQNDDAKALLTELRIIDPSNYKSEKLLGDIHRNENNLKQAIISYKNAYNSAPEDMELKKLIEELIQQSGLSDGELYDDRPMDANEEEMLNTLGQELMDEVKNDIGEHASEEVSDETVGKTVDEIVGAAEEQPLENFADDYSTDDVPDEQEEEALASVDDSIESVESIDAIKDAVADEEHAEEKEQVEDEQAAMPDADVSEMAAELSADLGLDGISNPADEQKEEPVSEPALDAEPESAAEEEPQPEEEEAEVSEPAVVQDKPVDLDDMFSFDEAVEDEMLADATEPIAVGQSGGQEAESEPETEQAEQQEPEELSAQEPDEPVSLDDDLEPEPHAEEAIDADAESEDDQPEPADENTEDIQAAEEAADEQIDEQTDEPAQEPEMPADEESADDADLSEPEDVPLETADEIIPSSFGVPVIDVQGEETGETFAEPEERMAEAEEPETAEPDVEESAEEEPVAEETAQEEPEAAETAEDAEPEPEQILSVEPEQEDEYPAVEVDELPAAEPEEEPADVTDGIENGVYAEPEAVAEPEAEPDAGPEPETVEPDEIIIDEAPEDAVITQEDEETVKKIEGSQETAPDMDEELAMLFAMDLENEKRDDDRYDLADLDKRTVAQVDKLENLLHLIKDNAK